MDMVEGELRMAREAAAGYLRGSPFDGVPTLIISTWGRIRVEVCGTIQRHALRAKYKRFRGSPG